MSGKSNLRVVIADDHDLVRDGLVPFVRMLSPEGKVEIIPASDLAQVMTIAPDACDLVMIDLRMPGMKGVDSLRQVVDHFPSQPVVVMSGYVEDIDIGEAMQIGVRGFIPKTMKGSAMVQALRLVLAGETFVPSQMLLNYRSQQDRKPAVSEREQAVLKLLAQGLSNKEMALALGIQEVTVKVHLRSIYRKLGVSNRVQAVGKFMADTPKV